MPDNARASPRQGASVLPPLSKFYYGPAQGWTSSESSPSYNGSAWSSQGQEITPTIPSRPSPSFPVYTSPLWMNNFPHSDELAQGWDSPSPAPSASSQFANTPYRPHNIDPIVSSKHSPVDPTWDSSPPEALTRGVNHKTRRESTKPPLPPRHPPASEQQLSYGPKGVSRASATTIDVPLFLQPVAYAPESEAPVPERPQHLPVGVPQSLQSIPRRLHMPAASEDNTSLHLTVSAQGAEDNFQGSYENAEQHISQKQRRRPQLDPKSYYQDALKQHYHQQDQREPMIPPPQSTSFKFESAIPLAQNGSFIPLQHIHLQSSIMSPNSKNDSSCPAQHLYQVPSSSLLPSAEEDDGIYWVPASTSSSSEQQYAANVYHDGQSISTADLSFNTAGMSTPKSHLTSDTSYREYESQMEPTRCKQHSDDSFYWHSGRSSSDAAEDRSRSGSPTATPRKDSQDQNDSLATSSAEQHENLDLRPQVTSLSPSIYAAYGASALGFGGPSDWEYFGDYEAEQIDDEELYSRPKPCEDAETIEGSNERSEDSLRTQTIPQPSESELPGSDPSSHTFLPKCESSFVRDPLEAEGRTHSSSAEMKSPNVPIVSTGDEESPSETVSGQQRMDLDEVIRAWSEAPYVGRNEKQGTSSKDTSIDNEESLTIAEASLASTPRERMLGIDVILKNAPSLPKLPDSIELTDLSQDGSQYSNVALEDHTIKPSMSNDSAQQMRLAIHLQGEVLETSNAATEEKVHPRDNATRELVSKNHTAPDIAPVSKTVLPSAHSLSATRDGDNDEGHKILGDTIPVSNTKVNKQMDTRVPNMGTGEAVRIISDKSSASSLRQASKAASLEIIPPSNLEDPTAISHQKGRNHFQDTNQSNVADPCLDQINDTIHETTRPDQSTCSENTTKGTIRGILDGPRQWSMQSEPVNTESDQPALCTSGAAAELSPTIENSITPSNDLEKQKTEFAASDPSVLTLNSMSRFDTVQDPYADLDPWGKASLNRFAAMLREEARAETNNDKLRIFSVFTSRESRLRVVLYGTDDDLIVPQKTLKHEIGARLSLDGADSLKQPVQQVNAMNLQRSLKALPALPANRESLMGLPSRELAPLVVQSSPRLDVRGEASEKAIVHGSTSDGAQYSPGGRPVLPQLPQRAEEGESRDVSSSVQNVTGTLPTSESLNPVLWPTSSAPIARGIKVEESSQKPGYMSFESNDSRSEVNNYLANRKSVIRPYATLTHESLENGSNFGREPDLKIESIIDVPQAAPTSQYNPIMQVNGGDGSNRAMKPRAHAREAPPDFRRFVKADFDPLLSVLPEPDLMIQESAQLGDLQGVMEAIPEDFNFIHQSVVAWDAKAKDKREENDRQRHARQMESEQRIDSLFDDHEIGYGDISELESEFKRAEAARRADEDRLEYQTFVSDVFNLVWTRLHYELDQLIPHYEQYSKLMNETLAGKDMFEKADGLALAPTMNMFLALHQKLEIRHQKAFEAVLERDRRLKKTEISPWYTLSNIPKVKQLEKQFEDAEKKAIIDYCEQRDTRANRLMDVLDQNTLRGVGANQDYMEAIMKAVRRVASGRAFASVSGSNEPAAGMEEVEKAKAITALLATSSEQIVQTFHVADMLLNSADYEVSLAKAKVAKADMTTLAKLKEERTKEDQKLMRDLEHRLALIREDSRRTNDEIIKLMLFLGVQNGRADGAAGQTGSADSEHTARMQKALDEAKRRNALKNSHRAELL